MRDRTSPSQPLTGQSHTAIVATLFVTKSLVTRSMFFKLSLGLITALTVTASLGTQDALAQVRIPVTAIEDTAAIDSLLEEGRQLELEGVRNDSNTDHLFKVKRALPGLFQLGEDVLISCYETKLPKLLG